MKQILQIAVVALLGCQVMLQAQTISGSKSTPGEIKKTAAALDELVSRKAQKLIVVGQDGRPHSATVKPVPMEKFVPTVSKLLKLDEQTVSDVLISKKVPLSTALFARLESEKTGKEFASAIRKQSARQWIEDLDERGVNLASVQTTMDNLYTELAFVAVEERSKMRMAVKE